MSCPVNNNNGKPIWSLLTSQYIDVPNRIGCNQIYKSSTLPINIECSYTQFNFTYIVKIRGESFSLSGIIADNGGYAGETVEEYPVIRTMFNNPSINSVFDEKSFVIYEQDVTYNFIRDGNGFNFIVFVFIQPLQMGSNGKPNKFQSTILNNPEILIMSVLLIDNTDIGDSLFKVKNLNVVKKYKKSCPKIVSVLRGVGLTALDKLNDIYITENIAITGLEFLYNIVEYSMVRYFLSKLLYGIFDIKYLLGKYYNKFIIDLKNSEFKNFVIFFNDPESSVYNYNQYFLDDFIKNNKRI